ncbi:polysaccharide biosynthesis/export family protein [Pollutibacter soli]|uniref:polysaccharide biosynthesis/export family protein n=1 Tax=Pollutibacter soli TaxID=3034157 RepID=UPI003013CB75
MNTSLKPSFLKPLLHVLIVLIGVIGLNSCGNTKKLIYFQPQIKGTGPVVTPDKQLPMESVIQVDDIISIVVASKSPEEDRRFNASNESTSATNSGATTGNTLTIGYLVNHDGDIQFPELGKVHAEGMTKMQLSQHIVKELVDKKLLIDPIVTVRFLNFRVTVIGEVARPGVYTVPNEKLSIIEAVALAGDLSIFGNRENVTLIRENGKGEKTTEKLNFRSADILSSEYYYLKSNDIIYVEPIRDRVAMERSQVYLPIIFSVSSFLIIVLDRFWR